MAHTAPGKSDREGGISLVKLLRTLLISALVPVKSALPEIKALHTGTPARGSDQNGNRTDPVGTGVRSGIYWKTPSSKARTRNFAPNPFTSRDTGAIGNTSFGIVPEEVPFSVDAL